jgi:hypothetical protein
MNLWVEELLCNFEPERDLRSVMSEGGQLFPIAPAMHNARSIFPTDTLTSHALSQMKSLLP